MRGHEGGCLAILGFEGDEEDVERRRRRTSGAAARGRRRARSVAARGRRGCAAATPAPYLRDELLDRGVMVETLETATTWANLESLHDAVGDALRDRARRSAARRRS